MEHVEVERAVRDWLDAYSINPATGVPPDALLGVLARRIRPFGQGALPPDTPASPEDQWSVTATLYFPDEKEDELRPKVDRILERLEQALAADPVVLAGDVQLEWRGSVRHGSIAADVPLGYPHALDILLTLRRRGAGAP